MEREKKRGYCPLESRRKWGGGDVWYYRGLGRRKGVSDYWLGELNLGGGGKEKETFIAPKGGGA